MTSYEKLLGACVEYIKKHGQSEDVLDKMETMLPGAWSANLIADALDIVADS